MLATDERGGSRCRENFLLLKVGSNQMHRSASQDSPKDFYGSTMTLSGETFRAQIFMRRAWGEHSARNFINFQTFRNVKIQILIYSFDGLWHLL